MIEAGIVSLLTADSGIADLVGSRIYPVYVPESVTYPCLSYQVVSGSVEYGLDGTAVYERRIQFDAWAETYSEVKQIGDALATLLDGYTGTLAYGARVIGCTPGVVIDNWQDGSRIFRTTAEYQFSFS